MIPVDLRAKVGTKTYLYHGTAERQDDSVDFATFFISFAQQYGYIGVFVICFLGTIVPFLPLSYLIVVVILSSTLNPGWLGLLAGIAGSLGKLTSYFLGRSSYAFAAGYLLAKKYS